ncbi:transporter, partial [Fusarium tjaetaba]
YRSDEVFKRAGVWYISSNIGAMFGGYMQAAAHAGLDGKGGAGSLLSMASFPYPLPSPAFFSIHARMQDDGMRKSKKIGKKMLKRVFRKWHFYIAVCTYVCFQLTTWVAGQMIVWVKSTGQYSVEMIDILPTGVQALAIVVGITVPSLVMSVP